MPLTTADHQAITHVVDLLRPNRRLLFLTGAGLSADSGMPTFRQTSAIVSPLARSRSTSRSNRVTSSAVRRFFMGPSLA